MKLSQPVFELLRANLPLPETINVLDGIYNPNGTREFQALLRSIEIPNNLRADLWDLAYPGVPVAPVSERAALEICRLVFREYEIFVELGVRERTGAVQDFILDVESQIREAIGTWSGEKLSKERRIQLGCCFAASGIWPVDQQTFERPKNR